MDNDVKAKHDEFEQRLNAINKRFDDMQWVVGAIIIFFGIVITANSGLAVYLFKDQGDAQEKMSAQLQKAIKEQDDKLSQDETEIKNDSKTMLDHTSEDAERQTKFVSEYVSGSRSDVNTWIDRSKQDAKEFRDEVNSKVSEGYGDPKLELLGPDNRPLDGGMLDASNEEVKDEHGKTIPVIRFEVRLRNSGTGPSGPVTLKAYSNKIKFTQPSDDFAAGEHAAVIFPDRINVNTWTAGAGVPGEGFTFVSGFDIWVQDRLPPGPYPASIRIYYGARRSGMKDTKVVFIVH